MPGAADAISDADRLTRRVAQALALADVDRKPEAAHLVHALIERLSTRPQGRKKTTRSWTISCANWSKRIASTVGRRQGGWDLTDEARWRLHSRRCLTTT